MPALQRQYPFDEHDLDCYAGAVPEPIDNDVTRASGLTLPELAQVELVATQVRRAIEKHAGCEFQA